MVAVNLENMDVDALLTLRADVDRMLADKGRDLQRQIALLGGGGEIRRRGRPPKPKAVGRGSHLKGVKVPPKYRGPGGELWAGRGATPRWLKALLDEGHSIEEFAIAGKGRKAAAAAKKVVAKKRKAAAG
jgi:DNA-binding protein H-NS